MEVGSLAALEKDNIPIRIFRGNPESNLQAKDEHMVEVVRQKQLLR